MNNPALPFDFKPYVEGMLKEDSCYIALVKYKDGGLNLVGIRTDWGSGDDVLEVEYSHSIRAYEGEDFEILKFSEMTTISFKENNPSDNPEEWVAMADFLKTPTNYHWALVIFERAEIEGDDLGSWDTGRIQSLLYLAEVGCGYPGQEDGSHIERIEPSFRLLEDGCFIADSNDDKSEFYSTYGSPKFVKPLDLSLL